MRIAIISDIHGNYPALMAVLEDAKRKKVDQFIFVGDYIFDLPYSNEVTEVIKKLENAVVIKGNKEGYLDGLSVENQDNWKDEQMGVIYQTFRELKEENCSYLMNLKEQEEFTLPSSKKIYVTHFIKEFIGEVKKTGFSSSKFKKTMEQEAFTHEKFLRQISDFLMDDEVQKAVHKIKASVIIVGHSHLQWYGYCGKQLVINPGSCGLPLDYDNKAPYTILEENGESFSVLEERVPYDIERVIKDTKVAKIYEEGKVWCDLVIGTLQTARDDFRHFFTLARSIAEEKNETGKHFSNETWNMAAKLFKEGKGYEKY